MHINWLLYALCQCVFLALSFRNLDYYLGNESHDKLHLLSFKLKLVNFKLKCVNFKLKYIRLKLKLVRFKLKL